MQSLVLHGIANIFHFTPLHYLPFIARTQKLMSKPTLTSEGYPGQHFRSTSAHLDDARGFGNYIHLSTDPEPPILRAKLASGFPHVGLELKTSDYTSTPYDLCRFNIAKTRFLRRNNKLGFDETTENGRYYQGLQIPIARTTREKDGLLSGRRGGPMIEVLVEGQFPLTGTISVRAYCEADRSLAQQVLCKLGVHWVTDLCPPPVHYAPKEIYSTSVKDFIKRSLDNAGWRGNGLEFDRV